MSVGIDSIVLFISIKLSISQLLPIDFKCLQLDAFRYFILTLSGMRSTGVSIILRVPQVNLAGNILNLTADNKLIVSI
jgi:hypothetical protein